MMAPAVAGAEPPSDDVVALCEAWLVDEHRWFRLSADEQRALPAAAELHAIDVRITALLERRIELRRLLPTLAATDARGITAKLAVAARVIDPEDDLETHQLLAGAVRELAGLRCLGCGMTLVGERGR